MSDERGYRFIISFDDEAYVARVPELGIEACGEDRARAAAAAEEALERAFEAAAVAEGGPPPPARAPNEAVTLHLKLAPLLAEDLETAAREMGLGREELATQILARELARLAGAPVGRSHEREAPAQRPRKNDGGGRRRNRNRREGYRPEMDNQADFLAYVRDMEKGGNRRR